MNLLINKKTMIQSCITHHKYSKFKLNGIFSVKKI